MEQRILTKIIKLFVGEIKGIAEDIRNKLSKLVEDIYTSITS